jgi:hypothetical protein
MNQESSSVSPFIYICQYTFNDERSQITFRNNTYYELLSRPSPCYTTTHTFDTLLASNLYQETYTKFEYILEVRKGRKNESYYCYCVSSKTITQIFYKNKSHIYIYIYIIRYEVSPPSHTSKRIRPFPISLYVIHYTLLL